MRRGFTLVEILIVIVVIAILAIITSAFYANSQVQARDLQLRDAGSKLADAVQLFAVKHQHFPRGGSGATTPIGADTECANGSGGFVTKGVYACTVEDTLVASGYLPKDFTHTLPPNTLYLPGSEQNRSIYIDPLEGKDRAMVMYAQEDPTAKDTEAFNNELRRCGVNPTNPYSPREMYGMRGGTCVIY